MSLFCLLWVPFFLILHRSLAGGEGGNIFALLFGSITAVMQFLAGDLITMPGGFGASRWFYGFVDIVCLPVLLPYVLYSIGLIFKTSKNANFADFALFWLVPIGALRAINWGSFNDPILLVAVPMLWTALAAGLAYLINLVINTYSAIGKIGLILCVLALPVAAAFAYWAFFCQYAVLGFIFFAVTQAPLVLSFTVRAR